jgi:hypothetical protein
MSLSITVFTFRIKNSEILKYARRGFLTAKGFDFYREHNVDQQKTMRFPFFIKQC